MPSLTIFDSVRVIQHRSDNGLNLSNSNTRRMPSKQRQVMLLLIIILGGDIQLNPGPVKYPCGVCDRPVARNHRGLECDDCQCWVHIRCGEVTTKEYENMLHQGNFTWICPKCALPNFSDSFFEENNLSDANPFDSLSDLDYSGNNNAGDDGEGGDLASTTQSINEPDNHGGKRDGPVPTSQAGNSSNYPTKTKLKRRQLKIMSINCDGLKGKQRQKFFASIIDTEKPDVTMGQESELDSTYHDDEVFPEGYLVKRNDRNANGGGVFIAYKDNIKVNEVKGVGKSCELVMFKIEVWKSAPLYVGSFYRPTDRDPMPIIQLQADLEMIFKENHIPKLILTGDFNLPSISWEDYSLKSNPQWGLPVNEAMLDLVDRFNLEQLVMEPTRINNTLDLILTQHQTVSTR